MNFPGVFGQLDLHGTGPDVQWTSLEESVDAGDDTIVVKAVVDWDVGDEIVISTSSYEANEAEIRTIASILEDGKTLILNESLTFKHISKFSGTIG